MVRTKREIQKVLEKNGITFPKNAKVPELRLLYNTHVRDRHDSGNKDEVNSK